MLRRTFLMAPAALAGSGARLPFSWDRVPVYGHLGRHDAHFSLEQAAFLARHYPLVTIEKSQARGAGASCEEGIYRASRQIKEINPDVKVLFYLNLVIDWPGYEASKVFDAHPEWRLRDRNGAPVDFNNRPRYDLSVPAMREWWSDTVANAMTKAPLDGVFADAIPKIAMAEAANRKLWGDAKYEAVERGLRDLLRMVKRKIGPDRMLQANGVRGLLSAWSDGGARYLDYVDSMMMEHFAGVSGIGPDRRLRAEMVEADFELMRAAAAKGKQVFVKAWPAFTKGFPDTSGFPKTQAERVELAQRQLEFPLALFLLGAEPGCFFGYSWGYDEKSGWLDWHPEYDRPLGAPKGRARKNGWRYSREFAHARVEADLERETGRTLWV
jgi:hypothetical protein